MLEFQVFERLKMKTSVKSSWVFLVVLEIVLHQVTLIDKRGLGEKLVGGENQDARRTLEFIVKCTNYGALLAFLKGRKS